MKDLLKKWLNGTAIWSEEKKLRQATEQDHFLAEAMEGYDTFPLSDHTAKIEQLKGRIRKPQQEKGILIPLRRIAAAAAIIGVIGTFIWVQRAVEQPAILSQHIDKVEAPIDPQENIESAISNIKAEEESQTTKIFADNVPETKISTPQKNALPKPVNPPTTKLNSPISKPSSTNLFDTGEPIADSEMAANQEIVEIDLPAAASLPETPVIAPTPESAPVATKIISKAEVVVTEFEPASDVAFSTRAPNIERRAAAKEEVAKKKRATPADTKVNYYVGQVQNEDGQPMHDVKIIGLNTSFKTTSKFSGDFILQADQPLTKIAVSKDGFHTRKIAINQYSDFLNVSLVKKTTTDPANPEMETLAPKPQAGFKDFFKYLENNRMHPTGAKTKGIERDVEIRFYIDENGTPTDLKVTNPDIYGFDKEAIRLLKEGPKWMPVNSHARYYVPFELE